MGSILIFNKPAKGMKFLMDTGLDDIKDFFENIDEIKNILEEKSPDALINTYYTLAPSENTGGAKRKQVKSLEILPFDIDHIDRENFTPMDYVNVACAAIGVDAQKTFAIDSGFGVQFFVEPVKMPPLVTSADFKNTKAAYVNLCKLIDKALEEHGMISEFEECGAKVKTGVDPSVWSPARLMRVPGVWNKKNGRPDRQGLMLINNLGPQSITIERASKTDDSKGPTTKREFEGESIIDSEYVKQQCEFVKHCLQNPKELHQCDWFAATSIMKHLDVDLEEFTRSCQGGQSPTLSSWGAADIARQCAEQAGKDIFGMNCDTVQAKCSQDKCEACPHKGKIKNPLNLKSPDEEFKRAEKRGFWAQNADGSKSKTKADHEALLKKFVQTNKYVRVPRNDREEIWSFNGKIWAQFPATQIRAFAETVMDPSPNSKTIISEFESKIRRSGEFKEMSWFGEASSGYIGFKNGVFDLKEFKLKDHDSGFGLRECHDFDLPLGPTPTPTFDRWIRTSKAKNGKRDEKAEFILLVLAFCALRGGHVMTAYFIIHIGIQAGNGKSIFMYLLKLLTAGAYIQCDAKFIIKDDHTQQTLDGKKILHIAEVEKTLKNKAEEFYSFIKNASDSGGMMVSKKGGQIYQIENQARLHLDCNNMPRTPDDNGIARRAIVLDWPNSFEKGVGTGVHGDKHLRENLAKEVPGIMYKVIEAGKKWVEADFEFEPFMSDWDLKKTIQFRRSNKPIDWFLGNALKDVGQEPWNPESQTAEKLKEQGLMKPELFNSAGVPEVTVDSLFVAYCEVMNGLDRDPGKIYTFRKKVKEWVPQSEPWRYNHRHSGVDPRAVVRGYLMVDFETIVEKMLGE